MTQWFVVLIVGASVCAVVYLSFQMVFTKEQTFATTQSTTVCERDSLLRAVSRRLKPAMTWRQRSYFSRKLRRAGLHDWLPEDLFAAQLALFIGLTALILTALQLMDVSTAAFNPFKRLVVYAFSLLASGLLSFSAIMIWVDSKNKALSAHINRALPSFMDLISISLSAGLNLATAFQFATRALTDHQFKPWCMAVLIGVESGRSLSQVLQDLASDLDSEGLDYFVSCIVQSENMGTGLAHQISDHANQMREDRYLKAEKLSMQAPVKMLFPLAVFIFPCNFLVLGFPIVLKILQSN